MKRSILKQLIEKDKENQNVRSEADKAEMNEPSMSNDRRTFLKKAAVGGITLGGIMNSSFQDTIAQTNVHCAAATQNFLALVHYSCNETWWEGLVKTTVGRPLILKGFAKVPDTAPGLGIELNDAVIKKHLKPGESYFGPTDEWNNNWSHDHIYS